MKSKVYNSKIIGVQTSNKKGYFIVILFDKYQFRTIKDYNYKTSAKK